MTRKEDIATRLGDVRRRTLSLLGKVPDEYLRRRLHSFYSPVGWHFGHIARTEEYWVCRALRMPVDDEALSFLFADLPTNPKENRINLPLREQIVAYMDETRKKSVDLLHQTDLESPDPLLADGFAWEFAYQHECQHQETITELLCLIQQDRAAPPIASPPDWRPSLAPDEVTIAGGAFLMGTDWYHAYDNEKMPHEVKVEDFAVAKHAVTAYQWVEFIADGGYTNDGNWSPEGRAWRDQELARLPEYWQPLDGHYFRYTPDGREPVTPDEAVQSISWFEAEAFAKWRGKRLLTEAEAEFVRRGEFGLGGLFGTVWEWTSSPFAPYPGFAPFPYEGYSKAHMTGASLVCRGGSWATERDILRPTFRNWYVPTYRQGFLGVRLADL